MPKHYLKSIRSSTIKLLEQIFRNKNQACYMTNEVSKLKYAKRIC